jgi:hypothetical protein
MDKEAQVTRFLEHLFQLLETMLNMQTGSLANYQRLGPFITVDDRLKQKWPLASKKAKVRIRDLCLEKYRQQVGCDPHKINGYVNGTFKIELEHAGILDDCIDTIRNEMEEKARMPLFARRQR